LPGLGILHLYNLSSCPHQFFRQGINATMVWNASCAICGNRKELISGLLYELNCLAQLICDLYVTCTTQT